MAASDFDAACPRRRHGVMRLAVAVLGATLAVLMALASPAHADAIRDKQWHLDFLKVAQLHKITKGEGVTVAVIDSGVDGNHPDLRDNVLKGSDFSGSGDAWEDTDGHGTAMASLIAGHGHGPEGRDGVLGLAPAAKILPGRVKYRERNQEDTDEAIDWAVQQRAGVMNLSFGGSGGFSHVQNALADDVVVVAAAGNTEQDDYGIGAPAAYPGVIAVSGVDRNGDFTNKSAYGPEIVLAAPMTDIMAAGAGKRGTYGAASGTSDATAIVSGVAALIRAKYPDISANGVINRLIKTATDKGLPGRDDKYGFGVINPLKALTADIPDIDYNPLIEGTGPSPNAEGSTAPPNAGNDDIEGTSFMLPGLALTAAFLMLAGLGAYFLIIARRRPGGTTGIGYPAPNEPTPPRPPPTDNPSGSATAWERPPASGPPSAAKNPRQEGLPSP